MIAHPSLSITTLSKLAATTMCLLTLTTTAWSAPPSGRLLSDSFAPDTGYGTDSGYGSSRYRPTYEDRDYRDQRDYRDLRGGRDLRDFRNDSFDRGYESRYDSGRFDFSRDNDRYRDLGGSPRSRYDDRGGSYDSFPGPGLSDPMPRRYRPLDPTYEGDAPSGISPRRLYEPSRPAWPTNRDSIPGLLNPNYAPNSPMNPSYRATGPATAPSLQRLISQRYRDPVALRLVATTTPQQVLATYQEVVQLILTRHLEPPTPAVLAQRGLMNAAEALQNPDFLRQVNLPQGVQVAALQQAFVKAAQQSRFSRVEEAVAAAQWAMQTAQQNNIPAAAIGMEFVYGAVESLDTYSAFVPPEVAKQTGQRLGDSLVGIGVQIETAEQGVRVMKIIPSGPAQQAGLQRGDIIVAVDGQQLGGQTLDAATNFITGAEGSPLVLSVARGTQVSQVQLVRRAVHVASVTDAQIIDRQNGIGYFKLETFGSTSAQEMQQALWALHQQGMRGLVLDLSGNPGGLLTSSIEIANLFLPSGVIVQTRGRTESDNSVEQASASNTWKVPLVVMVDENSASASEILAAAIQDNRRGVIVGRRSYGKGTVQTLLPLQSLSAGLRLTTAKFYSPSGREMAGQGVQPDVPVEKTGTTSLLSGIGSSSDRETQVAVGVARNLIRGNGTGLQQNFPVSLSTPGR